MSVVTDAWGRTLRVVCFKNKELICPKNEGAVKERPVLHPVFGWCADLHWHFHAIDSRAGKGRTETLKAAESLTVGQR